MECAKTAISRQIWLSYRHHTLTKYIKKRRIRVTRAHVVWESRDAYAGENVKIISFVQRARFHERRVCVFVIKTQLLIFYESSRRRGTERDGAFAFAFATIGWMRRKPLQREH